MVFRALNFFHVLKSRSFEGNYGAGSKKAPGAAPPGVPRAPRQVHDGTIDAVVRDAPAPRVHCAAVILGDWLCARGQPLKA